MRSIWTFARAIVEARVKVQIERKEAEEAIAAAHARIQLLKKIAVAANEASTIDIEALGATC